MLLNSTVLVVGHDLFECHRFCDLLSGWGYVAIPCTDARDALIAVGSEMRFEAVIVNHDSKAGIDGVACIGELKKHMPRIPFILCCTDLSAHLYLKALGLGVFECVEKTIEVREFRRVIAKALDARIPPADAPDWGRQEGRVR